VVDLAQVLFDFQNARRRLDPKLSAKAPDFWCRDKSRVFLERVVLPFLTTLQISSQELKQSLKKPAVNIVVKQPIDHFTGRR
jgi:hypothetical protein